MHLKSLIFLHLDQYQIGQLRLAELYSPLFCDFIESGDAVAVTWGPFIL